MLFSTKFLGRWIVTLTCRNDCLMVSDSPDPAGKWGAVYLSCLKDGPRLERNPSLKLGYDKNGIYICGVHAGDENPHTVGGYANDCFAVPRGMGGTYARTWVGHERPRPIPM
jgi:hypothetical protein